MRKINIVIPVICFLFALHTQAQDAAGKLKEIANKLEDFNTKLPIEKVHLHLDKPYYSVGDTIWIKAYVVDRNNQLSSTSNIVYVDLINDKDVIKTTLSMPLIFGQAWSAITMSDSLFSAGNYYIRAYTTIMRNYGTDWFFNKPISIVNALPLKAGNKQADATGLINSDEGSAGPLQPESLSVQFFPEGGNLIAGVVSKVAFKVIGADGLSRNINGYIIDQDNNRITNFKSAHAGMGVFKLFPSPGNSYKAVVNINGSEVQYPLPNVEKEGYVLSVTQNKENIQVIIKANVPSSNDRTLNLIAQANNQVVYSGKAVLTNSAIAAAIPKKYFPMGIVQITLLNADFKPIAERLIFNKHTQQGLKIDLNNITDSVKKEGRSVFSIHVTDEDSGPTGGAFSMAVTNENKVPYNEDDEISIFSNLLLSADLKGYIERPNYYFTDTAAVKEMELDNLLLTQGWRRFVWDDILNNKMPAATYKPENGDIGGVVLDNKKQPVPGALITMLFKTDLLALDTVADAQGHFLFNGVWPDKDDKYVVTATDKRKRKQYAVQLDRPQILILPITKHPHYINTPSAQLNVYQQAAKADYEAMQNEGLLKNGILLKEVKVNIKRKPPTVEDIALTGSSSLMGKGRANTVVTFKDLLACGGMLELGDCLTAIGELHNIEVNPEGAPRGFYARGNGRVQIAEGPLPMTIFQDGMRVDSFTGSMNEIASIEILKSLSYNAIYGSAAPGGAIVITTKKPGVDYGAYENDYDDATKASTPTLSNISFSSSREFYVPPYNTKIKNQRPQQSTIYWAPNIITNEKGSAIVEFPAAEAPGRYKIIIEGIDVNGNLGRKVYKYDH